VDVNTGDDYNYQTVPNLDLSSRNKVEFSVMAKNDAHVMLTMGSGGVFEIVIGGWGNTYSTIRRSKQGSGIVGYSGTVNSNSQYKTFVIDWSTPRVLKVFSKSDTGSLSLLMETPQQSESVLNMKSMAVATGWGSTGKWKVKVSAQYSLSEDFETC
jgi:hypothetical protein